MSEQNFTLSHVRMLCNALDDVPDGTALQDVPREVKCYLARAGAPVQVQDLGEALIRAIIKAR